MDKYKTHKLVAEGFLSARLDKVEEDLRNKFKSLDKDTFKKIFKVALNRAVRSKNRERIQSSRHNSIEEV